ncbi:haloacid dehalogenase (HAD) superfamily protein [Quillaja saponaria]|uniref:Haloacid dehalogenase (HAD) superfamily protein n=1 Tax=Quillaja saponaria TaxID=32244 RepID=A0AAD7PLY3_QUISA|nr:haloacid dehalogenase (HAD) superfamily protein [Quillaja saponaria]
MLTTSAAPLPNCWHHLHCHHVNHKRRLTMIFAFAKKQTLVGNLSALTVSQTSSCSQWQEIDNRIRFHSISNQNHNHNHPLLLQFYPSIETNNISNQYPEDQNQNQELEEEKKEIKVRKSKVLSANMWWTDAKAALGQRLNLGGIFCAAVVVVKDRNLALPYIAVPDIRYIDWAELQQRGFKGVVFDKDNTITAPYSLKLWGPLGSSLERCKSVFGPDIAVFSNSAGLLEYDHDGSKAKTLERAVGIKVIRHRVKKPAGTAEEIEKHFGCESSKLIMVGDRPFIDVVYGNRNGFLTILTEPLSLVEEPFIVRQVRKLETSLVNRWCRRGLKPPSHKLLPDPMPCVKDPTPSQPPF